MPTIIDIQLIDGEPDGIRVAGIMLSTIQAMAFRRNQLRRVRSEFGNMDRPGVYILQGANDKYPDRMLAYIGEAENVGNRLAIHKKDGSKGSEMPWDDTIVLISNDDRLTGSHARYIEARLIRETDRNPRWSLRNRRRPSDNAGQLSSAERAVMKQFVTQAKTLVGVLGCDLFRALRGDFVKARAGRPAPSTTETASDKRFSLRGKGFAAYMTPKASGEFVVVAGSLARLNEARSLPPAAKALRQTLRDKKILRRKDGSLKFRSDYDFKSVSSAAQVVTGASTNGWDRWKLPDPDGRSYSEWEAAQDGPE